MLSVITTHTHMHARTHAHTHTRARTHTSTHIHKHTHKHTHTNIHMCERTLEIYLPGSNKYEHTYIHTDTWSRSSIRKGQQIGDSRHHNPGKNFFSANPMSWVMSRSGHTAVAVAHRWHSVITIKDGNENRRHKTFHHHCPCLCTTTAVHHEYHYHHHA